VEGEFFVASSDQISQQLLEEGPQASGRSAVDAKGLTNVNIATLGQIVGAGTLAELLDATFDGAREADGGESGVYVVPLSVTEPLRQMDDVDAAAHSWAETEELRLDGWTRSDASRVLSDLSSLARTVTDGQLLWLWWSL
jgi:hypothetical protein